MLDLGRSGGPPPPVVQTGRDRRPLLIAAVVVAVLLGGLMLTSGASDDDEGQEQAERAEPSTSTSKPPTTTRRNGSTTRRPTSTTVPPPIAGEPIGARLAMLRTGEVALVDVDANAVTTREVPSLEIAAGPPMNGLAAPAVVRAGHLVFHAADRAWSVPLAVHAPLRELAPALLVLPSLDPRDVWLVVVVDGQPAVQRWRGDGSELSDALPLPVDWAPVAEVAGGLVLRRGSQWQVWDPGSGATVLRGETEGRPIAAHGTVVAWTGDCETPLCSIHLTDVATGADRSVFLGTVQLDWPAGTFSPDGRYLAVPAYSTPTPQQWQPGFLVVDVAAGTTHFEELSQSSGGGAQLSWSLDSRWLFVLSSSGAPDGDVDAYSPDRRETVELHLPNRASGYAMVAY